MKTRLLQSQLSSDPHWYSFCLTLDTVSLLPKSIVDGSDLTRDTYKNKQFLTTIPKSEIPDFGNYCAVSPSLSSFLRQVTNLGRDLSPGMKRDVFMVILHIKREFKGN